jgi:hypothetical protein
MTGYERRLLELIAASDNGHDPWRAKASCTFEDRPL